MPRPTVYLLFLLFPLLVRGQYTAIPDSVFEQKLIDLGIDSDGTVNGRVLTSDVARVRTLQLIRGTGGYIHDLTGIEDFINLDTLICNDHIIRQMDLSHNTSLKYLDVYQTGLHSLDVSALTQLEYLKCSNEMHTDYVFDGFNRIDTLDLSRNSRLKTLITNANGLHHIIFPGNPRLEYLEAGANRLEHIDFSGQKQLRKLILLTSYMGDTLDISGLSSLEYLDVNKCDLRHIRFPDTQTLRYLFLGYFYMGWERTEEFDGDNRLPDLDLSRFTELRVLAARQIGLRSIDLSSNPELEILNVSKNPLHSLDVSRNIHLKDLHAVYSGLHSLDVSHNPELEILSIRNFVIPVENQQMLYENHVENIDLSHNSQLQTFLAENVGLQSLDFSNNPDIEEVSISENPIHFLDLSENPQMYALFAIQTELEYLNLKNGHNRRLEYMYATRNPYLECIQVDDTAYAYTRPHWYKDSTAVYATECSRPGEEPGNDVEDFVLYPVPAHDRIYWKLPPGKALRRLSVYDMSGKHVGDGMSGADSYFIGELSSGIYLVTIIFADGEKKIKTFVKY
ncbi:MAG: T9SS type A sorting domain-containing protein [Chlorobi bacterium]|nr:T9SS type A sorting domain-containing protein [Chlorobiota bacterium]